MAPNVDDDSLRKILGRVPRDRLLGFRCVSKHWNRVISDSDFMKLNFMKLRSRRRILLPFSRPLAAIDEDSLPVMDMVRLTHSPLQDDQLYDVDNVTIVGTFKGIVLLALVTHPKSKFFTRPLYYCELVLYNPLTSASKKLVCLQIPDSCNCQQQKMIPYVFGLITGAGGDHDELKIVIFDVFSHSDRYTWDVFDLQTTSWSGRQRYLIRDFHFSGDRVATFLDGFLYWATSSSKSIDNDDGVSGVLALNVKDMAFSRMKLPDPLKHDLSPFLGSIDGCLCMVSTAGDARFDLWVRKSEQSSWSIARSFTVPFEYASRFNDFRLVCILTRNRALVIYDTSKDSCKILYHRHRDFEIASSVNGFMDTRAVEYVESLVSPFAFCFN